MVESIFRDVISISIIATIVALIVYVIRLTLGKYLPKKFSYYLWFIVLIRLIFPLNVSSRLSLFNYIPTTTTINSGVNSSNLRFDNIPQNEQQKLTTNINFLATDTVNPITSTNPTQTLVFVLTIFWIVGLVFFMVQGIIRYHRLSKLLETATIINNFNLEDLKKKISLKRNIKVYNFDGMDSPFIYGIINPKIIIPSNMITLINSKEYKQILTHELIHIKRFDNVFKVLWSFLACVHWFNPIVWLSVKYFNQDMELSCDEKVMGIWGEHIRKDYANSLIQIADKQNSLLQRGFIGFGETSIKTRIRNIMKYKKPKIWIILFGIILLAMIMIVTLTNKWEQVIYINENFGFKLTMDKKVFDRFEIFEQHNGIFFGNRDIHKDYPESMLGIVFRIEAYQKERFTRDSLEELNSIYNLQYIGENEDFYFGWAYPTDMQYPPDDKKLSKSFEETTDMVSKIIETIEIVSPSTEKYAYKEQLKSAYDGFVDNVEFGITYLGKDVVEKWGEPKDIDYIYGGIYLDYDGIVFYTDGYKNKDNSYFYGSISHIETKESYSIKAGMNIDEAIAILGKPHGMYSGHLGEGNEVDKIVFYNTGNYRVSVVYDEETKIVKFVSLEQLPM